jgi:hypothetical protein
LRPHVLADIRRELREDHVVESRRWQRGSVEVDQRLGREATRRQKKEREGLKLPPGQSEMGSVRHTLFGRVDGVCRVRGKEFSEPRTFPPGCVLFMESGRWSRPKMSDYLIVFTSLRDMP